MSEYDMPSQTYFCQCAGCINGQGSAFEAAPENWFRAKGISTPKNCPDCREWIKTAGDSYVYCQYCTGRINLYKKYKIGYHKYKGKWQDPTECDMCKRAGVDRVPRSVGELASQEKREEIRKRAQKRKRGAALAEQAGIPPQYWNEVVISDEPDGSVNIYFGGLFCADGQGHGHYVMDKYGNVTYKRDPQKAHGAQNFADAEDTWEKYSSSTSGNTGRPQTDYYFGYRGEKGGHVAINDLGDVEHVRDADGTVLHNRYDPANPYD